jgi:hypothetical protein
LPSFPLYPYDGGEGSDRAIKVNMESYIVLIYRGDTDNPHNLVGTVEQAGIGEKNPLPILTNYGTYLIL